MAAVRTFFVVSALSFHSVIEGLALTLEKDTTGIWMSFGAVAMHKFVIAFSVGVELVTAKVS
jgi:zinc transporter 1/2/3